MVHQILTGYVDTGLNRELAISLFRDARLMHRIVEGQKMNDMEMWVYFSLILMPSSDVENSAKPNGVRLGFMGHLTLMSEDIITALERFPPELRLIMIEFAPDPEWDEYVTGRYKETRRRDTRVLGGESRRSHQEQETSHGGKLTKTTDYLKPAWIATTANRRGSCGGLVATHLGKALILVQLQYRRKTKKTSPILHHTYVLLSDLS